MAKPKNPASMASDKRNANYDFKQKEPSRRMGEGNFANLPKDAKIVEFGQAHNYRDGMVNSYDASVSGLSGIDENRRKK